MDQPKEIPQIIQEHLGLSKTILVIQSINERIDIARTGVIPTVIKKLINKEFSPKEFIKRLSEYTRFNEEKALAVAKEIKEKILKPIEYALLNWGVDINEIDINGAKTIEEIKKEEEEILEFIGIKVEKPVSTISLESFSDTEPENLAPTKISVGGLADETTKKIEVSDEPAPLIIHREKLQTPIQTGSQISRSSQQTKGFSLPFGFFKQKVVQTQVSSTPVKATVEFLKKDELKRAVDYSELRTPLTPFSKKEEGFIKTEQPKIQNNFPKTNGEPMAQKVNPLTMFGNKQTTIPQQINNLPTQTTEKSGVLDIRMSVVNNKEPVISNYNKEIKNTQAPVMAPEIKKQPIIDVQKNIIPPTKSTTPTIEQKPIPNPQIPTPLKSFSVPERQKTPIAPAEQKKESIPPTSGKGFVWFKKPEQKTITMTNNNNTDKNPRVEGNTVDLRSNT